MIFLMNKILYTYWLLYHAFLCQVNFHDQHSMSEFIYQHGNPMDVNTVYLKRPIVGMRGFRDYMYMYVGRDGGRGFDF